MDDNAFRAANDTIARRARQLRLRGPVPFLCECRDDACFRLVRMPVDEYERRREHGPLTRPGHRRDLAVAA